MNIFLGDYMKTFSHVCALFVSLLIRGCATIFNGASQNVTITTPNNNAIEKTRCKVTNEEGEWLAAPDSQFSIHRDGNPMAVSCQNGGANRNYFSGASV
jgi:hypothetical protein